MSETTLRAYALPLLRKHDDDLGHYLEPASVDGVLPISEPRMVIANVPLTEEQHERMIALSGVTFLGLSEDVPQHDDPPDVA